VDGWVESLAFDAQGRLLFTNTKPGQLLRLDRPGAVPKVVASGIPDGGGIAVAGRYAYVGTGNSAVNGLAPALGGAGIKRVDLKTGKVTTYATGLAMANGVVRTAKGVFYASDAAAPSLDRVRADGRVDRGWLKFGDANGLALGKDERYLYANRSLPPTSLVRVDLRRPSRVSTVAATTGTDATAFLDGLTLDASDRPYAASFVLGEVWSVAGGSFCRVGTATPQATSVAFGRTGSGFDTKSLYVGSAQGRIVRLKNVVR
jgi:sugar lactone lactonase YvrE